MNEMKFGLEARFERRINGKHVELTSNQDQRFVALASQEVIAAIESGELKPGQSVIVNKGMNVALHPVPMEAEGEFSHYRFIDKGRVPDVVVSRDIGSPPKVIEQVARHLREEMLRPDLRRRYRLRPCKTWLLAGVSGTGKTLAVQAIHRQMYEIMAGVTKTPIEELPPRVFRMKPSKALSMWFGESDKNIDRFFDEVEDAAGKKYKNKRGDEFLLPVLVILEEADGMGRARGSDHDGIYDRIMTTTLQRLDPTRSAMADKLVVVLSTTNEPHIVDPAFLRRIGGSIETFGRLNKEAFMSVLEKLVDGLPPKGNWKNIIERIDKCLYEEGIDPGVVELQYQGGSGTAVKYRRDFMTPALIERAVQEAATAAWEEAMVDEKAGTISADSLLKALDHQILGVVHQLTAQNVDRYTDIPEGQRVTNVRRVKKQVPVS